MCLLAESKPKLMVLLSLLKEFKSNQKQLFKKSSTHPFQVPLFGLFPTFFFSKYMDLVLQYVSVHQMTSLNLYYMFVIVHLILPSRRIFVFLCSHSIFPQKEKIGFHTLASISVWPKINDAIAWIIFSG